MGHAAEERALQFFNLLGLGVGLGKRLPAGFFALGQALQLFHMRGDSLLHLHIVVLKAPYIVRALCFTEGQGVIALRNVKGCIREFSKGIHAGSCNDNCACCNQDYPQDDHCNRDTETGIEHLQRLIHVAPGLFTDYEPRPYGHCKNGGYKETTYRNDSPQADSER